MSPAYIPDLALKSKSFKLAFFSYNSQDEGTDGAYLNEYIYEFNYPLPGETVEEFDAFGISGTCT